MNESTKSYMFPKLFSSLLVFSGGLHRCFSKEKEERDSWHFGHHREQNENSKYLWNWWVRLNFMQESDVWYIKQRDSMLLYNRSQMTSKCSENKEVVQELLGITNCLTMCSYHILTSVICCWKDAWQYGSYLFHTIIKKQKKWLLITSNVHLSSRKW